MENHPIPQNVTGFQFKLIGDMTVKQFAYLAAGCILFYLFFFALPLNFLIKFPFAFGSIGLGLSLAFLPVGGRALDIMLVNFARAVLTPNQYVYQKTGGTLNVATIAVKSATAQEKADNINSQPKRQLDAYLNRYQARPKNSLDEKEITFLKSLSAISNPTPNQADPNKQPNPAHHGFLGFKSMILPLHPEPKKQDMPQKQGNQQPPTPLPNTASAPQQLNDLTGDNAQKKAEVASDVAETASSLAKEEILEKQAANLAQELEKAKLEEARQKDERALSEMHKKVADMEQELKQTLLQKEMLEKQIQSLSASKRVFAPSMAEPPITQTPNVRQIPANMGAKFGMPIAPEVANLIAGIARDSRGNILPNILVEITDKDGNPVRAFKTNTLGQFACATPLSNGVYTILFEDPEGKHKFDGVQITAAGEIIQPLEVISIDAREELRKELFG